MSRTIVCLVALSVCAARPAAIWAQPTSIGLISETEARRCGLERTWVTQVELDPARGRVTHLSAWVSTEDITTVFDVHYDGRKKTFSEHDVDRFGRVFGKEGAQKEAADFIEELKSRKLEGKLEKVLVPEISLYASSDRAVIHAINAESGATRWAAVIGDRDQPTERPGPCAQYVAVLNGSDVYLLQRATGDIIWKRRVKGVPGAGAAVTSDFVVVPTLSGDVQMFSIKDTRRLPESYKSNGRVLVQPLVTPGTVAWPTDRGFLYAARTNKKGLRYRLEAKETIVSPATFFPPNHTFVASVDGYVYCLHEATGSETWLFSTGEAVSNSPIPIGENLFVVTDRGSLFCLEIKSGQSKWISSGLKRFLAASQDRVYCLGDTGRVVVLDIKTGGRIASLGTELLDLFFVNELTDRIYVGTKTGLVECLRETARSWPLVHVGVKEPGEAEPAEGPAEEGAEPGPNGEKAPPKAKPEAPPAKKKPAGKADDPFGAGGDEDPFGGGQAPKPAAGGKPEPADDPFGAGAEPAKEDAGGGQAPMGGGDDDPFK
jgi:outer membrane protein assembly factor BamB